MSGTAPPLFAPRGTTAEIESGLAFQPKFGPDGLIPAIATDVATGEVLMFAWMNAEALARTIQTGLAHFWSRTHSRLWLKGEESGNLLRIAEMRVDCDQDAIWFTAHVEGKGVACHTGEISCFYRRIPMGGTTSSPIALESVIRPARR